MLWGTYFINVKIIEIGRLQYEFYNGNIKIHIPKGDKLIYKSIITSLENSKDYITKYFNIYKYNYYCDSWLLSSSLKGILNEDSNILKFQSLFEIRDGKTCIDDILNFVFEVNDEKDFTKLIEETSLQKKLSNICYNATI